MIESQAEFDDWRTSPVGRKWFKMVAQMREDMKDVLAGGGTLNSVSIEATAMQTAYTVGGIEAITKILEYKV
jgi:hypothetical protein